MPNLNAYPKIIKTYHLRNGQTITIRTNESFTHIIAIRD